ncbi:MAG: efflux RND transporter periplasmic adaptor subunit [Bacteroidota bacterium]|nr:efflux RND transporter periplasmic adaptor subunit [Bacteroidota bacterium]
MNKNILILILSVLMLSCGKPDSKKAQYDKLIAERDKLNVQIEQLEKELKADGKLALPVKINDVKVDAITEKIFKHYIDVQGKVDGDQNTTVSPETAGTVTRVYVKEGDKVGRGQILAELDAKLIRQSIEEAKTQLDFATNIYNKQKNLWDKRIGSEVQYLTAKNNKESMEKRIATLKEQFSMTRIKSPISGSVEEVQFKVGQAVSPGAPGSNVRVVNMSTIKVIAELSEAYSAGVKQGNEVLISFPDYGEDLHSRISFSSRFIDPVNRTFKAEAKLSQGKIQFRANMIATMKINDYTNPKAIVIPVNVIQKDMQGQYVLVAGQNGKHIVAIKKPITTGSIYGGYAEILNGLQSGEQLITAGYMNLKDGQFIRF